MATGTQTGIRTGSAPALAAGGKKSANPMADKILKAYESLTKTQKIAGFVVLALILISAFSISFYQKSNVSIPLYGFDLTPDDFHKATTLLCGMNIPYTVEKGTTAIMVPPGEREHAVAFLAINGIPRRILPAKVSGDGFDIKTKDERDYEKLLNLQSELSTSVRNIEGIADAYVIIAKPEKDYFSDVGCGTTATVQIALKPGASLNPVQVKGIMTLISSSVENLDYRHVSVIDEKGMILSDDPRIAGSPDGSLLTGNQQLDMKMSIESSLRQKVQSMLDLVLGPKKARVELDVVIDYSTIETKHSTVGGLTNQKGEVVIKRKSREEKYLNSSKDGDEAHQMALKPGRGSDKMDYESSEKTEIIEPSRTESRKVTPAGRIERITASLWVDNLKPDLQAQLKDIVKGIIGFDESRGDYIAVASVPGRSEPVAWEPPNPPCKGQGHSSIVMPLIYAAFALITCIIIAMSLFMLQQHRLQNTRSRLILASGPQATVSDIADLVSSKTGYSEAACDTRLNTTVRLERLAAEKPMKVAELLRNTWLAEKA